MNKTYEVIQDVFETNLWHVIIHERKKDHWVFKNIITVPASSAENAIITIANINKKKVKPWQDTEEVDHNEAAEADQDAEKGAEAPGNTIQSHEAASDYET